MDFISSLGICKFVEYSFYFPLMTKKNNKFNSSDTTDTLVIHLIYRLHIIHKF